jgi:putative peptidoglycan lipid II flippase
LLYAARVPDAAKSERQAIATRASIVGLGTLVSRLLGLVREQVLAAVFARAATDVFFVAFLIPNVLRQVLAEGAVQNGVLPVLTEVKEKQGIAAAHRAFRAQRGLSFLLLSLVSVLGVLAAPWLVDLFAGGFKEFPGKFERTVTLTRWVFPYIFFMGTAAMGVAALNTERRFVVTSFAPGLLNVAFIAAALALPTLFASRGWDPLLALACGVLLGGVLQVVAQWPSLEKVGYLGLPSFELSHPAVREVLRRMAPVLFGFGVYYVDVIAARHILSTLGEGAPSFFTFAQRLCDFPQGIFVMALQTATLPTLASLAARGDTKELGATFEHGLRLALFVAVPASIALPLLSQPFVMLLFERGHFGRADTIETAHSMFAQGAGIWAVACVRQLVIVFFALGDTRTPVVVSALDFLVFLAAALLLSGPLGHVGVAWAVSLASVAQMALLFLYLRRKLPQLELAPAFFHTARTALCALGAGLLARFVVAPLVPAPGGSALSRALPGLAGFGLFVVAFVGFAWLARVPELRSLVRVLGRRFGRRG